MAQFFLLERVQTKVSLGELLIPTHLGNLIYNCMRPRMFGSVICLILKHFIKFNFPSGEHKSKQIVLTERC
jgi:hypothetical protein